MNALDTAIFSALHGDAAFIGLSTGGVHHLVAPENAAFPRTVFNTQSAVHEYTLTEVASVDFIINLRADGEVADLAALSDIHDRANALLTDRNLTVQGYILQRIRRMNGPFDSFVEKDGIVYPSLISLYRVSLQPA